ncbi:MAG: hypothetical protein RIR01_2399 [Bacteroidota bacterium]|jgi:hypothetical protein
MRKLKQNINTSLKPEERKKSNVEVEKGEVVFTKQDPTNNIFELYNAAGKKHSQGGTPLNLPTGDGKTKGSSFIYSDKLKVKDKEVLDFFGFESKKKLTIADLVRPLVGVVNESKAILLDKNADKIAKVSAEKNLDNARFKLDAAKLYQESLKGMEDVPDSQSFFDKTGLEPDKVFGLSQQDADQAHETIQKALGGLIRKDFGGDPQVHYYEDEDPTYAQSDMFMQYGGELPMARRGKQIKIDDTQSGPGTVQDWVAKDPANKTFDERANQIIADAISAGQIVKHKNGTIDIKNTFQPSFKDRMILSKVFNQAGPGKLATTQYSVASQQADNIYSVANPKNKNRAGAGSFVGGFTPEMFEKRYIYSKELYKQIKAGKSKEEAELAALDIADQHKSTGATRKEFMSYLGTTGVSDDEYNSDDFYKKNFAKLTSAIESKFPKDQYRKYLGNDSLSGYDHFDAIQYSEPEKKEEITPLPGKEDTPYDPGKLKGIAPNWNDNPYGFRREDINSLNRAIGAKNDIRMLMPYQAPLDMTSGKVPYYSMERAIANTNEQLGQGVAGLTAFGNPQSTASNITSLFAQAYGQAANEISNYSDKNVSQETINNQQQAQTYNQLNAARAASNEGYADKVNNTMQNFMDSIAKAKDMITGMKNNALENASGIYNVNTMQEHYKIDPVTGLKYFVTDKNPFEATTAATTNAYEEYQKAFKKVGDRDLALKLVAIQMGKKTDKSLTDEEQNNPTNQ